MKTVFKLTIGLFTLTCSSAFSASLRISPVKMQLPDTQQATSLSLFNESAQSNHLQIRVFKWVQENNQDQLLATDDIVVSPPIVKLASNTSLNLRVVRQKPAALTDEHAYRVIIDELPNSTDRDSTDQSVNVLLRSSLPLFISPKKSKAELTANLKIQEKKGILHISNSGGRHTFIKDLNLIDHSAGKTYKIKVTTINGYILAKQQKAFLIEDPGFIYNPQHTYKIKINTTDRNYEF